MSGSLVTPWTVSQQAPDNGVFQVRILERVAIPPPKDLLNSGIKLSSPASPALAGRSFTTESPGKPLFSDIYFCSVALEITLFLEFYGIDRFKSKNTI